jgi:hypothetical protein
VPLHGIVLHGDVVEIPSHVLDPHVRADATRWVTGHAASCEASAQPSHTSSTAGQVLHKKF